MRIIDRELVVAKIAIIKIIAIAVIIGNGVNFGVVTIRIVVVLWQIVARQWLVGLTITEILICSDGHICGTLVLVT